CIHPRRLGFRCVSVSLVSKSPVCFNSQIMLPAVCQFHCPCFLRINKIFFVPHVTGHNLLTQQHSKTPEISDSKSNSSICLSAVPVNGNNNLY
ncbi:unnamed protein product, partial [Musa acuminata var. zebrina]